MNSQKKYISFLEQLIGVTGQKKLIESVISAHNIIFEADVIPSSRYGAGRAARGDWEGMVNNRFTGAVEGDKTSKPSRMQQEVESRARKFMDTVEGGSEFVNDVREMFSELVDDGELSQDMADSIVGALENADPDSAKVKGTPGLDGLEKMFDTLISKGQYDTIFKYLTSIAGDTGMGRLANKAQQYYGFDTVDEEEGVLADEFDELFMRGIKMGELAKQSGATKIGNPINNKLPNGILAAAKKYNLTPDQIKELQVNYSDVMKSIKAVQSAFINYIWNGFKSKAALLNKQINEKLITARNNYYRELLKNRMGEEEARTMAFEKIPSWPYREGTGIYQTMFKNLISGGTEDVNKALNAIGLTPESVVSQITRDVTPENSVKHLNEFLKKFKQTKLSGYDDDHPSVIAANALAEDNTQANETYNRVIQSVKNKVASDKAA